MVRERSESGSNYKDGIVFNYCARLWNEVGLWCCDSRKEQKGLEVRDFSMNGISKTPAVYSSPLPLLVSLVLFPFIHPTHPTSLVLLAIAGRVSVVIFTLDQLTFIHDF